MCIKFCIAYIKNPTTGRTETVRNHNRTIYSDGHAETLLLRFRTQGTYLIVMKTKYDGSIGDIQG